MNKDQLNMNKPVDIKSINLSQECSVCDSLAAKILIVEPNGYPNEAVKWSLDDLSDYEKYRNFDSNYLIYSGPGGSNGNIGDAIDEERKTKLINAFTAPFNEVNIREQFYDMAGYCVECQNFYCSKHWNTSSQGYGKCPQGHGKSLDPHWSPNS
ncbi:hypothetical protein Fluta_3241 [Fluviicola taffensis DSM 16823]|uniref:Uncharacterized protein n=2 Tax=Fluviicola TaxID=332102 RepID=F2IA37_FLUTR|nr:hypothetical protein Fluta_3241 [Fluviicola taffensis DSM 16823]